MVTDLLNLESIITKEVQTIGAYILVEEEGDSFADTMSLLGVARIVA